jgi:hypothetical protein
MLLWIAVEDSQMGKIASQMGKIVSRGKSD